MPEAESITAPDSLSDLRWSTNEGLLQNYRSLFVSSQSFLLAVGMVLATERLPLVSCIMGVVAIYVIWDMWVPVVRSRHLIVDFYKHRIEQRYRQHFGEEISTTEYVHHQAIRQKANDVCGLTADNWSPTRRKLDQQLPLLFTLIWMLTTFVSFRSR